MLVDRRINQLIIIFALLMVSSQYKYKKVACQN